ncbi:MAG: aminopeptidase [Candidatus Thorarchaeota archaeon]|nr:aminopeptidase [Candidatus Thorarchaeota archaeon]
MDPRIEEHAKILVEWSTEVKPGDNVIINATPEAHELVVALYKEIAKAGGRVITLMTSEEALRAFYTNASDETLKIVPEHMKAVTEKCDVFISLRSPVNTRGLTNVDNKKIMLDSKTQQEIQAMRLSKRWSLTVHPCQTLAQEANMSLEEYRDFVYGATLIDWAEESKMMYVMKEHLENHKDIRYIGPETDLYASTEGRIWVASDGKHNMPSGEVFTAPVDDSVEGKIYFDIPFLQQGKVIEGVRLTFEKGEVVDFSAEKEEATLKSIIEIDEGSRRLGEMAIGTNRGIKQYTLNMLFDEKIGDTIHCALGRAYKDCNGVNESAVHVDMIKSMLNGEIYAGDELIYSKGKYFYEM